MNIGNIIYDYNNNTELGVIVYPLNDRYILFKLENNTHPIFSRLPITDENNITIKGNINETSNQNLKLHLLKYYHKHNLSHNERKLLEPLMNYAYPNGIPDYKTTTPNSEVELEHMNLIDKLKKGNKFYINTTINSPFNYLNEQKVYIIDITDNGIWIGYQDGNSLKLAFLPYANKSLPSFHGISKLIPISTTTEKEVLPVKLEEEFKSRRKNEVLYNMIEHNNNVFKLNEKNEIIGSQSNNNSYFDFTKNKILLVSPPNKGITELHELSEGNKTSFELKDKEISRLNDEVNELTNDDNIQYGGNIEKTIIEEPEKYQLNEEYLDDLKKIDNVFIENYKETENNNVSLEDELEIIDDEIEIIETVDKVQQKPVPELEKVLDESIQMSNIRKYKIEKLPISLRKNQRILDKLTNKIQKEVNIISFMKAITTNNDNSIIYRNEEFKPLVEEYSDYDFQNNFLTPLVVSNKRIYLTPSDKVRNYDSAIINENMLEVFKDINRLSLVNKKRIINYRDNIAKTTTNFNPYPQYDMKPVGISVVFGSGKTKKYINYLNSIGTDEKENSIKLESIAARLNIQGLIQDTEVIRYGLGKDFEYDNYGGLWDNNKNYDSYKVMGPLVYFKEKDKVDLALLESKIDKNIDNVNPSYDIIYKGDITNMVGFIRMPIKKYINGYRLKKEDLSNSNNVIIKYLDEINNNIAFDDPNKIIVYIFSKNMNQISEGEYYEYLQKVIPSVEDIVKYVNNDESNNITYSKTITLLNKLHYYIDSESLLNNSKTDKLIKLTYGEYKTLKELLDDDIKLYEDLNKELSRRYKSKKQKQQKKPHKIVHKSIVELCNGIYNKKLTDDEYMSMSDKQLIHYYRQEIDSGYYFDLQLQKYKYDNISGNKNELENTLTILKTKYDKLTNSVGNSEKICNKHRKQNIILYDSIERLLEDNGKVITNSSGQLIKPGDYAYIETGSEKHLYKREALTDGDYWLEQPITELEKLQNKETENCKVDDKSKLEFNEDAKCSFDMSKLQCIEYNPIINEVEEIEEEIKQTISSIDLLENLHIIKEKLSVEINKQEEYIRFKFNGIKNLLKIEKDLLIQNKLVEEDINKCIHNKALKKIKALKNLTDYEKYLYYYEIINQFHNIEHTNKINLDIIEFENIEENYLQCGNCNKRLICKHYLYVANQIKETGNINYETLKDIYAEDISGSYYCRICGIWLFNTDVKDDVQFASGDGGKVIAAREIIEEQQKDLIAKNKDYINKLINDTLSSTDNNKDDIEIRLKLYDLFKKLSNIKSLLMDDEITMINYIKSYNYIPKTTYNQLFKAKFAGKGVSLAVIEKYADIKYKQNYVLELAGLFLVVIQCGGYSVYNKFAGNIINGYPLLDETEMKGIGYMSRIIQSVAELYDFMDEWKLIKSGSYESIKLKLFNTIKKSVIKDEYIINLIDKTLNNNYEESTFNIERANKASNYWNSYKPKIGRIIWKPEKDVVILNKDNLGKYVDKQLNILQEQIDYSSMNIISLIYGYVYNLNPSNIHYLRSRIINSSMPINFNKLNQQTGKYKNPEINYYNKIYKNVNGIQANLNNINNYTEYKIKLNRLYELNRIKINSIIEFKLNRINVGNGSLTLTKDELHDVSNKFITTGNYRGMKHIYDKNNVCIVSNQTKKDIEPINQGDYLQLLSSIQQKNLLLLQNKSINSSLKYIINVLKQLELPNEELVINKITNIYNDNTELSNKLYGLTRQYNAIIKLSNNKLMSKKIKPELKKSKEIIIINIKNVLKQIKIIDIKQQEDSNKMLFSLISNMNTLIQNYINDLKDKLTNNKDMKNSFEEKLIKLGYMTDIINDYKTSLYNRENVINYLNPINFDKKTDEYAHYIISQYLSKMFNYTNVIINMIINNNWVNETNITQYHYKKYFRYGNSKSIFKEWSYLLKDINDIYNTLTIIEEDKNCFNYEYIKVMKMYIFIYMLKKITKVKKSKEIINEVKDRKAFSFYSYIDTSLSTPDDNTEEIIIERDIDNTLKVDNIHQTNDNDFIEKIETHQTKSRKIMIEFVTDIIEDLSEYQKLYNKMNDENRTKIKEETKQKQTRLNLGALKSLKNNYDTDYNLIMQKMKMGAFSYNELYDKVKEQIGEDFINDNVESYNNGKGGNYDLGDAVYDPIEAEEIGEVNVMEAEDMEDYEADYGNMVVS
jgi:hypothetical protein